MSSDLRTLLLTSFLLVASNAVADFNPNGVCSRLTYLPGLPKASCTMPACPTGSDCEPPVIDRGSAQLDFEEPFIQWQGNCPDRGIQGPCWVVRTGFTLRLRASDPSGIAALGATFQVDSNGRRVFEKYWGKVERDSGGSPSSAHAEILGYSSPGQKLDLALTELCARDNMGNERCVLPLNGNPNASK